MAVSRSPITGRVDTRRLTRPASLARYDADGWLPLVTVRDSATALWVLYREDDRLALRDLLTVSVAGGELVVSRVSGDLSGLVLDAAAMSETGLFGGAFDRLGALTGAPSEPGRRSRISQRGLDCGLGPRPAMLRRLSLVVSLAVAVLAGCGPAGPVTEFGALEDGDPTLTSGEWYDGYAVTAREGQWISVVVTADGFDPYLILQSPGEGQSEVDDSDAGDTTTTRLAVRADASGRWEVVVTSYAPGESGRYTVTYGVSDERPTDGEAAPPGGTITV